MGGHIYFPCGIPLLWGVHRSGCCQLHYQQADQLLSYFTAPHHCSVCQEVGSRSQPWNRFEGPVRFKEPVPLPSLRAGHGMEITVIVILGACRCPLSWTLYKCTDNASLHLKNL